MATHITIGTNDNDYRLLTEATAKATSVSGWAVPKPSKVGDRVLFFIGRDGFVASGVVSSTPIRSTFRKRTVYRAKIGEITFLASPVPIAYVIKQIPEWKWATYPRTFVTPEDDVVIRLNEVLQDYQQDLVDTDQDPAFLVFLEGKPREGGIRFERSARARAACIAHYGSVCVVCGIDFGSLYGPEMQGLIEVHHLKQIAGRRKQHIVDPVKELRPVCPNCHWVIHRRTPPYKIKEVQAMLKEQFELAKNSDDSADG